MYSVHHILLIEADRLEADRLQTFLEDSPRFSFRVTHLHRSDDAKPLLARGRLDLIVLGLDQEEAAALKTLDHVRLLAPTTPVLVLTARENPDWMIRVIRAGAQDCVPRNKMSAEVLTRICRCTIERFGLQRRIDPSEPFLHAAVDVLTAHIAILDYEGHILAVNQAWRDFAADNEVSPDTSFVGTSYFEACNVTVGEDMYTAAAAEAGIRSVIAGERDLFELEYPCHSPEKQRWFQMRVTPFGEQPPRRTVVAHEDITIRKLAEIEKKHSDDLFEQMFTMAPLGLWLSDVEGRLLRGNPEAYRIWDIDPAVPLGRRGVFTARRIPESPPINPSDWAIFRSVREGVTIRDELLEVETKDGTKRYILNYTAPLKNEQGKIKGGMIANLDITKRVLAQRKAEDAEQRIRLIFDTSPNCLFIKDNRGRYLFANHATVSLFHTTENDLIGKTDEQLHGGRWEQQVDRPAGEQGEERCFIAKNGTRRCYRFFTAPVSLPGNEGIELTIAVDITETRQVQEELRQSESQKRMILDSLDSQVVMLDRDLSVLWANKTAIKQKIDDQNCPVHCFETGTQVQQPYKPCADCPTLGALETGAPAHATRKTKDGRTFSVSANPILDEKGDVYRVVVTSVDITERLSLERQLRQAQKMESLGTLAGGIAHDFNNILAALLGYADLARIRLKDQPVVQEYLEQVNMAGKRATELVRQILTFSRRQDADLQPLQVPLVIKEALKLLRSTLPTSVELEVSIDTAVDPVLADPTQIHQIIMNLCINASHAMEPDGGKLTVKIDQVNPGGEFFIEHQELSPGPHLRLQVSDTGCGMTPEILSSIFGLFVVSSGFQKMLDRRCQQVDDADERVIVAVSPGPAFGGLEDAVERLDACVAVA